MENLRYNKVLQKPPVDNCSCGNNGIPMIQKALQKPLVDKSSLWNNGILVIQKVWSEWAYWEECRSQPQLHLDFQISLIWKSNVHLKASVSTKMSSNRFYDFFHKQPKCKSIHKWLHYFDIYEKHFKKFQVDGVTPTILEIVSYTFSIDKIDERRQPCEKHSLTTS